LVLVIGAIAPAAAAPRAPVPSTAPRSISLGNGTYAVTATVFGTPDDGLIGAETASGHVLQRNDRLVALPACTESSCPWLSLDSGVGDHWGPQTACAEDDGLCWVQLVSDKTGDCAVAPVLDLGPLFVHDNWWAPSRERSYPLSKGVPAAEAVNEGKDVGFGPGISDRGYNVGSFQSAPAIDIGAGTWRDLGLPVAAGVSDVHVTLLWQAGVDHSDACGGGGGGNATVTDDLNLRTGPGTGNSVIDVMPDGSRVTVLSGNQNGFYQVRYFNTTGWASGDYLRPDGGATGSLMGVVTEDLNFRGGPSTADAVIDVMPAGALVVLGGDQQNGFLDVRYDGQWGWAYAEYLAAGEVGGGSGGSGSATVREELNLRAGPSTGDDVLAVMPAGADVTLSGDRKNGFVSVAYRGLAGWAYAEYLDGVANDGGTARVSEAVNLRSGPSTKDDILDVMPVGADVSLSGESKNGYVSVNYGGEDGWAAAAYLTTGDGPLPAAIRTVSEDLNLRKGPSRSDSVIRVMPAGANVVLTGERKSGYVSVTYKGKAGWAYAEYLE
jgi:uncharacterized protein YraI